MLVAKIMQCAALNTASAQKWLTICTIFSVTGNQHSDEKNTFPGYSNK